MKVVAKWTASAAIALLSIACLDTTGPSDVLSLTDALITLPAGFTSTSNSFGPGDGSVTAFMPPAQNRGGRGGPVAGRHTLQVPRHQPPSPSNPTQ